MERGGGALCIGIFGRSTIRLPLNDRHDHIARAGGAQESEGEQLPTRWETKWETKWETILGRWHKEASLKSVPFGE